MSKKYKKNFLTNVICRLDFNPILKLKHEEPADFQDIIRHKYSKFFSQNVSKYQIQLTSPDENDVSSTVENFRNWIFKDQDEIRQVTLQFDFITLEYKKYSSFLPFLKDFNEILQIFEEIYRPDYYTKLGLRYINQIHIKEGNTFDWSGIINKDLYSVINNFIENKKEVARSFHNLIINKDDYRIIFRYGMYNSDYPNNISQREFILDYDCRVEENINCDNVNIRIKKFNEYINNLFERSIEDGLRDILRGDL